jgi:MYXO-CTERM domain-containing protein
MARPGLAALLLLAAPAGAWAQFRDTPMIVRLPSTETDVLAGEFVAAGGDGLLVLHQTAPLSSELRPWHDLLGRNPGSFPLSGASGQRYRAGYLSQNGTDALADVARPVPTGVGVVFGSDPSLERTFTPSPTGSDSVASFVHLLPKPADVIVVPVNLSDTPRLVALDFDTGAVPTPLPPRVWTWTQPTTIVPTAVGWHEAFPVVLSDAARTRGIHDVAVGVFGGVLLFFHTSAPASANLSALKLSVPPVLVGGYRLGLRPPWLPATAGDQADALGVAALDVDLDGAVDLVFTNATAFGISPPAGSLLWVRGTGNPADFADPSLTPWGDLGRDPALGLVDPLIVRGIDVGGQASFAVWDRALQEVVVATPDAALGGLRVWRAPAPGERAVDIRLADLVGTGAKDLVVTMSNPSSRDAVLVYPDAGDASPALAWQPGSPGTPERGVDLAMAVQASDPDGPAPRVDWMIGDPSGAPVAQGLLYTYPGVDLCPLPPPDLAVTVRATDDLGVFTELAATLPVAAPSPSLGLADPGGRLVLVPGGATATLEGTIALACGATASWGGSWPAGVTFVDDPPRGSTVRRTAFIPEAEYPSLLSGPVVATLATSEPLAAPVSSLTLDLDATGLADVRLEADRPVLAEGEVAVLRAHVRSRLGVPVPLVRIVDVLSGLAPAGAPRVTGATVLDVRGGGAEVVVDALPPAPAEIVVDVPVSSTGGRAASAAEVRSSGDYLLTPAAGAARGTEVPLGCGCGTSADAGLGLFALLALARRRGRRRAGPRLT